MAHVQTRRSDRVAHVHLKVGALSRLASERGWINPRDGSISAAAVAAAIGVSRSTVSRILGGTGRCGPGVISGLLLAAPDRRFSDLFERQDESDAA